MKRSALVIFAGLVSACASSGASSGAQEGYRLTVATACSGDDLMVQAVVTNVGMNPLVLTEGDQPWRPGQRAAYFSLVLANRSPLEDDVEKQWPADEAHRITIQPGGSEMRAVKLLALFPEARQMAGRQTNLLWRQRNPKNPNHSDAGVVEVEVEGCQGK
jgi:hypothetical protein